MTAPPRISGGAVPEQQEPRETVKLFARPEHPAPDDLARLGHVEIDAMMAERGVEDPALSPTALPDNRHHRPGDPGGVGAIERGRRQHLVRRIDVQVVLLGVHREVGQPSDDRRLARHRRRSLHQHVLRPDVRRCWPDAER